VYKNFVKYVILETTVGDKILKRIKNGEYSMKRVLLKLSGEALAGEKHTGFDEPTVVGVAKQVAQLVRDGIEVGIVIGGGNFWRGRSSENIDRTKADQIGMLATVMNCIYVSEIFRSQGMKTQIFTPFSCGAFTELFSKDKANEGFANGVVSFFAGGTGHPYFSTDTTTVLRAVEIEADVILLAKSIDGVYDKDPKICPDARKYDEITIQEVIDKRLGVVDLAASILCMENKMPMLVFGLNEENSIVNTVNGTLHGTKVTV
jgi:uridylate kinase